MNIDITKIPKSMNLWEAIHFLANGNRATIPYGTDLMIDSIAEYAVSGIEDFSKRFSKQPPLQRSAFKFVQYCTNWESTEHDGQKLYNIDIVFEYPTLLDFLDNSIKEIYDATYADYLLNGYDDPSVVNKILPKLLRDKEDLPEVVKQAFVLVSKYSLPTLRVTNIPFIPKIV